MKTDHFAEFRRDSENQGNAGNRVTGSENCPETKDFSLGQAVTQDSGSWVTRVTESGPQVRTELPVTHVTQTAENWVTGPDGRKPMENQEKWSSVTRVTHVTQKSEDAGEVHKAAPVCQACQSSDLRVSQAGGLICRGCGRFLFLRVGADAPVYPFAPLRACGALVCRDCRAHSPSTHREDCQAPRFDPCGSPYYWLSPCRAIKCVACEGPANLSLVEGWVMARDSDASDSRVPDEILKLLNVGSPMQ